jgi:hypothetical protein
MPYIAKDDRKPFEPLKEIEVTTAGELQYCIALLIKQYEKSVPAMRYQNMNDVMGALNGANLEYYRRTVAPYEDLCIERNGDV